MPAPMRVSQPRAGEFPETADNSGHLEVSNRLERIFAELAEIRSLMNNLDEVQPQIDREGDSGRSIPAAEPAEPAKDDELLNGPALAGDVGIVSQDDIDSLFN